MTIGALIAALTVPLSAAQVYVLDLSERTEVRVRAPGDALDVEQVAGAHLTLQMPRSRLGLGYSPRLSFTDVIGDNTVDLLHTGELTAGFDFRKVNLSLAERVAYGTRSFTSLTASTYDLVPGDGAASPAPTPTGDPTIERQTIVPVAADIHYASADSSARLGLELSRRLELTLGAGYLVDGGLDQRDRRVIPWAYGPRASVELGYELTRRDTLTTTVEGESYHTDTASGATLRSDILRAYERLGHRFSVRTSSELSAGVAVAQRSPSPDPEAELFPIGSASLEHVMPTGERRELLELEGSARVTVLVDRLTGVPDHRLDSNLGATWSREPYQLYGVLGRTQSLDPDEVNALVLYSGEVGARYQWTRPVLVEGGYRLAYQTIESPSSSAAAVAADGFNWLIFVALQVTAEPIRF